MSLLNIYLEKNILFNASLHQYILKKDVQYTLHFEFTIYKKEIF
jgi:hypothetical protein